jgi:hypothetical protein
LSTAPPAPAESSVLAERQPTTDLAEQVLAVIGRHGDVVKERAQQADVAFGVIVDRPVDVLDRDRVEESGRLDLLAEIRQLTGAGRASPGGWPSPIAP